MLNTLVFGGFKTVVATIIMVAALTPTWIWSGIYFLVGPTTEWARLLTVGLGLAFLGVIQLICLAIGAIVALSVLTLK
jgi:hypothetical protein